MRTKPKGLHVETVSPGTPAQNAGFRKGDRILEVDGNPVVDQLDFRFYASDARHFLEIGLESGDIVQREILRDDSGDFGIDFRPLKTRGCGNHCIFCFADQHPPGMRKSLYFKDEDFRFSFLYGNYVTLSHVSDADVARICRQRLSPLFLSVHTTEQGLRDQMLGTPAPRRFIETLRSLADAGIDMHTQIVLCPEINDGPRLDHTIADLFALRPEVLSIAVVPVGLTRFREGLVQIKPVTGRYAEETLLQIDALRRQYEPGSDGPWILQASDEFYLASNRPFPDVSSYGDLPQYENGVGMVPRFLKEANEIDISGTRLDEHVIVVTGKAFAPYLQAFLDRFDAGTRSMVEVAAVPNDFFGGNVDITGLLTGQDILRFLKERTKETSRLLIPEVAMRGPGGRFLDDMTREDLANALGLEVHPFDAELSGFMELLLSQKACSG